MDRALVTLQAAEPIMQATMHNEVDLGRTTDNIVHAGRSESVSLMIDTARARQQIAANLPQDQAGASR